VDRHLSGPSSGGHLRVRLNAFAEGVGRASPPDLAREVSPEEEVGSALHLLTEDDRGPRGALRQHLLSFCGARALAEEHRQLVGRLALARTGHRLRVTPAAAGARRGH